MRHLVAFGLILLGAGAGARQARPVSADASAAVAAELGRATRCAAPTSIAVVAPSRAQPAGVGMFIVALQQTRLRSGPVTIVERSRVGALASEACTVGGAQTLTFAKFIAVVSLVESGGRADISVEVVKTSTGEAVFADRGTAGSVSEISAILERAARQTNAAISEKNYQCDDTFDLVGQGTLSYACSRKQTTTATMSETMSGSWPIGFTAKGVDPWKATTQAVTGVVTLGAGSATSSGVVEAVPPGARPCSGMRSTFDDRLAWSRGSDVGATFRVTAPGASGGVWKVALKADAPGTSALFGKAGATVTSAVKAGAAPGDCPATSATHSQPFTPVRGFGLPEMSVDIACRPAIRVDLAEVPAMSFSLMALETGRDVADCRTRVADLTVSLRRRF